MKNYKSNPVTGGIFSSFSNNDDGYILVEKSTESNEYKGIKDIKGIYEPGEFPNDPTLGFSDKKLSKAQIGLSENQSYYMSRTNGIGTFECKWGFDKLAMVAALQGIVNRVSPNSLLIDGIYHGYGMPENQKEYLEQERNMSFICHQNWEDVLNKASEAFNGIIIFEDTAENNGNAAMLIYNLACISGCLPVQRDIYNENPGVFKNFKIIAYFKEKIPDLSALNYSTRVILPLTSKTDAFCPSIKLGNTEYSPYQIMQSNAEGCPALDLPFCLKMFIYNIPAVECMNSYKYFERIMTHLKKPAVIWGWVTAGSEAFFTNWGHGLNEFCQNTNSSFFNTLPLKNEKSIPYNNAFNKNIKFNPDKIYITFSGESLDAGMFIWNEFFKFFYQDGSYREKTKINWGFPSSFGRLFPSFFEMAFLKATKNDYFYNFCGDSYIHTEGIAEPQLERWQNEYLKNSKALMKNATPWFSIADQDFKKFEFISQNQPETKLFVTSSGCIPDKFYDGGYDYLLPIGENEFGAKFLARGSGYNWYCGWSGLTKDPKVYGNMDIQKTADYLLDKYNLNEKRLPIYGFWGICDGTLSDFFELQNLLETDERYKGKFEIVSLGEANEIASQIPKSYLDNIKNSNFKSRNAALSKMVESGEIVKTDNTTDEILNKNYIYELLNGEMSSVTAEAAENSIRIALSDTVEKSIYGWYLCHIKTKPVVLPHGARYVVMDVEGFTDYADSILLTMTGNFGKNGEECFVCLTATSQSAKTCRSGRTVISIREEVYEYTDQGYPVNISAEIAVRGTKAAITLENISFVSEKPEIIPCLRINGFSGKRLNDTFICDGIAFYPFEALLKRLELDYTIKGNCAEVKINGGIKVIDDLKYKDEKLFIPHTKITDGIFPFDVWFDEDTYELSINK